MTISTAKHPELSCYLLPGHTTSPADAITEAQQAETLSLGKVWLSERFDVKDAGVICSAALASTSAIRVATAGTNLHTPSPDGASNDVQFITLLVWWSLYTRPSQRSQYSQ